MLLVLNVVLLGTLNPKTQDYDVLEYLAEGIKRFCQVLSEGTEPPFTPFMCMYVYIDYIRISTIVYKYIYIHIHTHIYIKNARYLAFRAPPSEKSALFDPTSKPCSL